MASAMLSASFWPKISYSRGSGGTGRSAEDPGGHHSAQRACPPVATCQCWQETPVRPLQQAPGCKSIVLGHTASLYVAGFKECLTNPLWIEVKKEEEHTKDTRDKK